MALRIDPNIYQALTKALTANGTATGVLTVASTDGLFVKQKIRLSDNVGTVAPFLVVMEVLSATQFRVGQAPTITKHAISTYDCSAFTVANSAAITVITDTRDIPEQGSILLAAYETSPVNALRVQNVDAQGNYNNTINIIPAPVTSLTEIAPQYNELIYSSITGTNAGTANTILTLNADRSIIQVFNSLDESIGLTYNGVQYWKLEAFDAFVIDCRSNNLKLGSGRVIGVFYTGGAPTTGSIRVTVL